MNGNLIVIAGLVVGYLLGSIPFGLLLTRLAGAGDIRDIGSGNIGATNVLRTGRKGLAAATLLLDGAKGYVAVALLNFYDGAAPGPHMAAAIGAMLGHCFPAWLGFKGGKGVATLLGVALGLAWPVGLACMIGWVAALAVTRVSSLGGMSAAAIAPIAAAVTGNYRLAGVLLVLAILVIARHHANIGRLMDGTEPRVGSKK